MVAERPERVGGSRVAAELVEEVGHRRRLSADHLADTGV
jgi:hypothetical protein